MLPRLSWLPVTIMVEDNTFFEEFVVDAVFHGWGKSLFEAG